MDYVTFAEQEYFRGVDPDRNIGRDIHIGPKQRIAEERDATGDLRIEILFLHQPDDGFAVWRLLPRRFGDALSLDEPHVLSADLVTFQNFFRCDRFQGAGADDGIISGNTLVRFGAKVHPDPGDAGFLANRDVLCRSPHDNHDVAGERSDFRRLRLDGAEQQELCTGEVGPDRH